MPNDWWTWLGVISSLTTLVAFAAYVRERVRRQRQTDLLQGFLHGLAAQASGLAEAGEQWRYNVGKGDRSFESASAYANAATNGWLTLRKEVEELRTTLVRFHGL